MNNISIYSLIIVLVFTTTACRKNNDINGNGNITTRTYDVGEFENITSLSSYEVILRQSDESSVVVETDENIFEYLEISTSGNTLTLSQRNGVNLNPTGNIKISISDEKFNTLRLEGSGTITSENQLTTDGTISLNISGSGNANLHIASNQAEFIISGSGGITSRGTTNRTSVNISGSGSYTGRELIADTASVNISGSGGVSVHANDDLSVIISGSGSLVHYGDPKISSIITSGTGSVTAGN